MAVANGLGEAPDGSAVPVRASPESQRAQKHRGTLEVPTPRGGLGWSVLV